MSSSANRSVLLPGRPQWELRLRVLEAECDRVNADDDKEEDGEEKEEAPGESVDAHLAIFLHADLLQWVKVVRNLPEML